MRKTSQLNASDINAIRDLYCDGEKVEYISNLYDIPTGTINRLMRECGISKRNRQWSLQDKKEFMLNAKTMSNRELADKYGMSVTYVCVAKQLFPKQIKKYDHSRKNLRTTTK